jgi:hypothetical protein
MVRPERRRDVGERVALHTSLMIHGTLHARHISLQILSHLHLPRSPGRTNTTLSSVDIYRDGSDSKESSDTQDFASL